MDTHSTSSAALFRSDAAPLPGSDSTAASAIEFLHFGEPGARPKAYLQAGLHADEFPGMLVLRRLAEMLSDAAARGEIIGEVVLAPAANPIGLKQVHSGFLLGRACAETGENFNRNFPALAEGVALKVGPALAGDAAQNTREIRRAMGELLDDRSAERPVDALRLALMRRA
ncbi:MAG: succinylglutamate desuccinylase/aspartoacylase family protein, partial [Pseudomonadota bacterium]